MSRNASPTYLSQRKPGRTLTELRRVADAKLMQLAEPLIDAGPASGNDLRNKFSARRKSHQPNNTARQTKIHKCDKDQHGIP